MGAVVEALEVVVMMPSSPGWTGSLSRWSVEPCQSPPPHCRGLGEKVLVALDRSAGGSASPTSADEHLRSARACACSDPTLPELLLLGTSVSCIATLVERQSRFVMRVKIPRRRTSEIVTAALAAKIQDLPAALFKSFTCRRPAQRPASTNPGLEDTIKSSRAGVGGRTNPPALEGARCHAAGAGWELPRQECQDPLQGSTRGVARLVHQFDREHRVRVRRNAVGVAR